jgi:hypothetical protein
LGKNLSYPRRDLETFIDDALDGGRSRWHIFRTTRELAVGIRRKSLDLMADLSMVAQGFRPSPSRAAELVDAGFVWVMIAKPPQHGLTALGKTTLISLVCDDASLDLAELATAAERLTPSVTDFASGTAFLDELESRARSGQKIRPTLEQGAFLLWLLAEMPSTAPTPPAPV